MLNLANATHMSDTIPWRRKGQQKRSLVMLDSVIDEIIDRQADGFIACGLPANHKTSKPRLTSRLSNIFSPNQSFDKQGGQFLDFWNDVDAGHTASKVDNQLAAESILATMLANPNGSLPRHQNSALFQVLEAYRVTSKNFENLVDKYQELQEDLVVTKRQWAEEENQFRDEIKRLEIVIARGDEGLSSVVNVRANSVVNRQRKIRARHIDGMISHADRKRSRTLRSASPSSSMTALSSVLSTTTTKGEFLLGKPQYLSRVLQDTLVEADSTEERLFEVIDEDEPFFKYAGDPLPDETGESVSTLSLEKGHLNELQACRHLATLVAQRRKTDLDPILSDIVDLCFAKSEEVLATDTSKPSEFTGLVVDNISKNITMTKIVQKMRTSLSPTERPTSNHALSATAAATRRPFSFDPGDDAEIVIATNETTVAQDRKIQNECAVLSGPCQSGLPRSTRDTTVRRIVSDPKENFSLRRKPTAVKVPGHSRDGIYAALPALSQSSAAKPPNTFQTPYVISDSTSVKTTSSVHERRRSQESLAFNGQTRTDRPPHRVFGTGSEFVVLAAARTAGRRPYHANETDSQ